MRKPFLDEDLIFGVLLMKEFQLKRESMKRIRTKLLLIWLLSILASVAMAQSSEITGKITDEYGEGLPGASIIEKGATNGTVTNLDGEYKLEVAKEATIVISFVGYIAQEIVVGGQEVIDFKMIPDAQQLEELVIVGYGTQKKASVTGAVSTVKSKELTVAPMASTTAALVGRIPGLIAKQESGLPGSDGASLNIRGFGAPLVIVDGVQMGFNNIDANEIASVTVLKDASAAIYGARAGNGVILVTTKRGKSDGMEFNFNSAMSFQKPTNLPTMASSGQMAELYREAHTNSGQPEATQRFTQEEVDLFKAGTDPDYPNTDWYDVVARDNAPMKNHNMSVRGGTDKIKFFGFLGYTDQETMFKGNAGGYKRFNFRSNIDAQLTDNLSAQVDIAHIWEDTDLSWRNFNGSENTIWQEYWNTEPFFSATNPDGSLAYGGAGGAISMQALADKDLSGYNRNKNQQLTGSMALNYDFNSLVKGLKAKAFVNINQGNNTNKYWRYLPDSYTYVHANDTYTQQTVLSPPDLVHTDSRSRQLTGQLSLSYNTTIGEDHEVSALALYEVIDNASEWIRAGRGGYTTTAIQYLFNGSVGNQTSDGRASEMGRQSMVFRGNYAYKSKYLLEATVRMDESAKFNEENRRGYFPSVSLGWRLSEEGFIKGNLAAIDNLKLRMSYSNTGYDNVANFNYISGYEAGNLYTTGGAPAAGLVSTGIANPMLTWEDMKLYNVGLDFAFFDGKLFGEFDVFKRNRDGIPGVRTVSLPSTFGAELPVENLNAIETTGFELTLGYDGSISDFSYKITANISKARSKWTSFDEPEYEDEDQARINTKTGQYTDRTFGYVSQGLFTSQADIDALDFVYDPVNGNAGIAPGDIRYQDVNGDGLLDWKDQVEIGKGNTPNWMGGLNFDLGYKNFSLTAFFQGGFGFTQQLVLKPGANYSELNYNERWTPETNNDANALFPRTGGASSNNWNSDFYQRNSDYVRLKNLSFAYNIPSSILDKANIQSLRLYVAGTNLFTISEITKYDVDPEAPSGLGGFYYPQMRTISFGINLTL
ncbi:MAG: TonB-dependent receptor [Reichenbachiella sp.]